MGMTDIMLNIPRKVVHEYSTPMMFCTVPTDPPAAPIQSITTIIIIIIIIKLILEKKKSLSSSRYMRDQ